MIRFHDQRVSLLFFLGALIPLISDQKEVVLSHCNQTCGSKTVPYPFGFSAGCQIPLNCTDDSLSPNSHPDIRIGEFTVRNMTSDGLLIDVPPSCNRSIDAAESFFGENYAMTAKNGLLLRNCSSALSGCVIDTPLLAQQLDPRSCSPKGGNLSCFSNGQAQDGFLSARDVTAAGCSSLFTSFDYDSISSDLPSLVFSTVELGWWLVGECRCSADARCTILRSPVTRQRGFRCRCPEGFEGDGFLDGTGCRKAMHSSCTASSYMSGKCGGSKVGVLIAGIGAGATLMACMALICCLVRRRSSSSRTRRSTKRLLSQASCAVPLYSYRDIDRATNGFSDSQRLGTGAYGTVYGGKLSNDKLVAVKKIKHRDPDGIEQVMNEIKLLSSVSHPNLVRLLGCCIERGEQILVYEYMANGTLSQHLQRERGPPLPWTVRLTIATETAKAIAYLHSAIQPPIYHRDIKSSNILLDYNFNSKVADFGLSRIGMTAGAAESSHISTAPQGTPGYLDPQYHQNFHLSDKSDVYSFGVVLVEIITAQKVVDFNRVQSEVNLAALAIEKIGKGCVDEIIDPFLEPNRDAWTLSSIHKVAELAFRCLAFHRDMRPSMMEVVEELEQIRISGWAPSDQDNPNIFMSPASSLCSSPSGRTEKSRGTSRSRSAVLGGEDRVMNLMIIGGGGEKVNSPISVQDPWFSEQSSPSTNSLLGNARNSLT